MSTRPISLLFGVHAHQPVGNFDSVMEEAHARCYRMFLQTVENYPDFRFSVHFSGWLLDWLLAHYPQDMARLAAMTRRGQVEWFGSGDCEPVLAAIPHRDRISQINTLSDKIERVFGQRPRGAWLTERVWESAVVPSLADCGIRYVAVDDYHFLCAGESLDKLDGYFTTEENDHTLDLFPISEQARYRLPFSLAEDAVRWLEDQARAGRRAAVYFDDIEKFGIWPETYHWVYEQGWLTRFIKGVLASPLIQTGSYGDFHAGQPTRGIVYLPTTSYIEMNEWTLPGPAARAYRALCEQEKQANRFEARKAFLRGGMWRNFFMRYPESNWMHKRMLAASHRFAALPPERRTPQMQEMLHRTQANDAYWHGLFGGLYLPHLRRAIWNNLLALENTLAAASPLPPCERSDVDYDGHEEIFLRDACLQAVVRDDGDAAIIELSSLALAHNFGDTLRRHDEAYHDKLSQARSAHVQHGGIASAHDRIAFRNAIDPQDAQPDSRARALFVDDWIPAAGPRQMLRGYRETDGASSPANPSASFSIALGAGRLDKSCRVENDRLVVRYQASGAAGRLETQINLAMPSCDGYLGRYIFENGDIPCGFGDPLDVPALQRLQLDDGVLGGSLLIETSRPVALAARAHRTVSQSEAGFEKIMQAVELTFSWPLDGTAQELCFTIQARKRPA